MILKINLSSLDYIVFFFIFFLTILAVFYGEFKKQKGLNQEASVLDHLLMGRALTLPLFIANLVATWYGGIFGVTQITFESGIYNFLTQGVFWYLSYIIFALFLVPKLRKYQAMTLPDLVGQMFGPLSEKISAWFNLFNILPVSYALSLGLLLQFIFGGNLNTFILLGPLLVVAYSLVGGMRSVVYSDLVQFLTMCLSVALIFFFAWNSFGGLSFLQLHLPATHFEWLGGHSIASTLVWGFLALATLVDPSFYQRVFAAKNDKVAKLGILISTLIWVIFDFFTTAGALYARATLPDAPSEQAYLIMAMNILPEGLKGFILAGIFATIASTLDSFLFIASTTMVYDLFPKRLKTQLPLHRLALILSSLLASLLAISLSAGGVRNIWKTLGSYSAGCLLLPLMLGHIFPGKISDKQFTVSTLMGALSITLWRFLDRPAPWDTFDELYIGLIVTGIVLFLWRFKKDTSLPPTPMK